MPLSIYPISEKAVTIAFGGGISKELMQLPLKIYPNHSRKLPRPYTGF
jgi:hypothetical protein